MRVNARHGFIEYYPADEHEVRRFERAFGIKLKPEREYFTFEKLVGLPRFSILGAMYGNLPAISTYEGRDAAEVFKANKFVYHMGLELIVPLLTVTTTIKLPATEGYTIAPGAFVQPGAIVQTTGQRLVSYRGEVDLDLQRLYLYGMEFSV